MTAFMSRWRWEAAPCTLALVSAPLISAAYGLTGSADMQGGDHGFAQGLRGVLCLLMGAYLISMRRLCLLDHPLIRPLTFLAGYAILTAVLSANPYENILYAVKLGFICLVCGNVLCLVEQQICSERWLALCAWMVLILVAAGQIFGLMSGNTLAISGGKYATGGFTQQTAVTAAQAVSIMPVILWSFPHTWSSLGGVGILLVTVFFTMRRTELIAAVAAIGVVLFFNGIVFRQRVPWQKVVVAVLAITMLAWIGLRTPAGTALMARFQDLDPSEGTGSGRYVFWGIAFDHIMNRTMDAQVVGEGIGAIRDVLSHGFGLEIGCHNDWLDVVCAFGVVGLLAFGWWYLVLMRFIIGLYNDHHPAFCGALSVYVILILVSFGTGGVLEPTFAVTYASLGLWGAAPIGGERYEYAQGFAC